MKQEPFKHLTEKFNLTVVTTSTVYKTVQSKLTLESYSVDHGWKSISYPSTLYTVTIPEEQLERLNSIAEEYNK